MLKADPSWHLEFNIFSRLSAETDLMLESWFVSVELQSIPMKIVIPFESMECNLKLRIYFLFGGRLLWSCLTVDLVGYLLYKDKLFVQLASL